MVSDEVERQYGRMAAVLGVMNADQRAFAWMMAEQAVRQGLEVLAPTCPGCGHGPALAISVRQVFCGNEECRAFMWDMTRDPARFKAEAQIIDLERGDDE